MTEKSVSIVKESRDGDLRVIALPREVASFVAQGYTVYVENGAGQILADAGIRTVLSGIRTPRMNSIMERWVQELRHELLDRTLIWNQRHLLRALREFEDHHNQHRPHQAMDQAAPLRPVPQPVTDPRGTARLDVRRRDRLGGIIHEYQKGFLT